MAAKEYASNVFVNCPFDEGYKETFDAVVFAVFSCGLRARCSKEGQDSGEVRMHKILRIISECKYGIHDISRTELCKRNKLPRFNMPLELGIFLGAGNYGTSDQRTKICLIMDKEEYRFQKFMSDIAGQDIKQHAGKPENAIRLVTDWLRNVTGRNAIVGGLAVVERYKMFRKDLPKMRKARKLKQEELGFNDYANLVSAWIKEKWIGAN